MKIIHLKGYSAAELKAFVDIIQLNIIQSMQALIQACETLEIDMLPENKELAKQLEEDDLILTKELAEVVEKLWKDPGIQTAYSRSREFQLMDSAAYFLNDVHRFVEFTPKQEDVLRARAKTSGISEIEFQIDSIHFKMLDVGGQRSERKKWIHCFQDVTAVIFVASMSEYDQTLFEDDGVNRMHETIKLFDEICNGRWFRSTSIILFLNKVDLFKEKIAKTDLKVCFVDYTDGCDFEKATAYIEKKFEKLNKVSETKHLYCHKTCATDTENIRFVFNSVKDILTQQALGSTGF